MNHKTDMHEALQLCIDAMLHDGVPTDPYHPRRVALNAAEAAFASRPDAYADARDREILEVIDERDRFERDATELAEKVGQYLGVDVGEWSSANDPIIAAMEALDERVSVQQSAQADERRAWDGDSRESRSAFRNYDSIAEPVRGKTPWQIWRDACAWQARAAAPQAEAAQGVPDDVRAAVERMCAPLHESRLSGVTAQEDAWCMKLIRDYVLGTDAAAHSPDREQVGEAYPRPATSHCQNGGDVCLAGNRDGVCCPEDSCDIDDGVRKSPDASASRECGERQECHHGQDNGACGWCYDEAARGEQMAMNREDVERQYKDGIHIGSGLPRATCPCGLCSKHRFGFNSGGGVPIAAASASTLSERSECTCGNGLGHARHCPAFDESKMRYEPFALPQPQAAEPRGLTLEQREAIKWALGVAHSGAKATPEGLLMFNRWKALCALLSKGE